MEKNCVECGKNKATNFVSPAGGSTILQSGWCQGCHELLSARYLRDTNRDSETEDYEGFDFELPPNALQLF